MGIGQTYPVNSYESILKCINSGADGSEIDVQLTHDSILVAYHGGELSDNTNKSGLINDYNWHELTNVYYTNTPYLNYSLLSLDQLFSSIENLHNYKFTFDCKLYTNNNLEEYKNVFINSIVNIVNKYDLINNLYIESTSIDLLIKLQEQNDNFKLFFYPSSFKEGLDTALVYNFSGITISTDNISKEQIEIAHNKGLFVAIWNCHSRDRNIDAIKKNPDIIQTDKVNHLIKLLE